MSGRWLCPRLTDTAFERGRGPGSEAAVSEVETAAEAAAAAIENDEMEGPWASVIDVGANVGYTYT